MRQRYHALRALITCVTVGALLWLLAGCSSTSNQFMPPSGGDGNNPPTPTSFGSLRFEVQWPTTRVIPTETQQLFVRVTGEGIYGDYHSGSQTDAGMTAVIDRPESGEMTTGTTQLRVPIGYKLITIYAADATGKVLAYGQGTAAIQPEQSATARVTLSPLTAADQKIMAAIQYVMDQEANPPTSFVQVKTSAQQIKGFAEQAVSLGGSGSRAANAGHLIAAMMEVSIAGCDLADRWGFSMQQDEWGDTEIVGPVTGATAWMTPDPVRAVRMAADMGRFSVAGASLTPSNFLDPITRMTQSQSQLVSRAQTRSTRSISRFPLPMNPGTVQADMAQVFLPALNAARSHIDALDFSIPMEMPYPYDTIDAGRFADEGCLIVAPGDEDALRAVVSLLQGVTNQFLAYDLTLPDGYQPLESAASYDANHDGQITPNEYMPTTPFGTLCPDGQQRMSVALASYKEAMDAMIASANAHLVRPWQLYEAGELFQSEPDYHYWYEYDYYTHQYVWHEEIYNFGSDTKRLSMLRDICMEVRPALNGTFMVSQSYNGLGADFNINIPAVFTSPIADMRNILPTFTMLDPTTVVLKRGAFPDPTFGDLIPDGVPERLLYPSATGSTEVWIY